MIDIYPIASSNVGGNLEIWRDILGMEGLYQVSNTGKIRSFKQSKTGKILSIRNKTGWYLTIILIDQKNQRLTRRVHRLVAEAFIPNPAGKPEVNHLDGNKQNNHVENLEWVSASENVQHAVALNPQMVEPMRKYNQSIRPNPVQQFSLDGQFISEYRNAKEAWRATKVCSRNILQVAHGDEYKPGKTRKQAGGFIWKFRDEDGGDPVAN
ncbi:NUMOD4 domain-containing protein [Paenibacillus sp. GYB004]|uniref:NUMOD4 domain-containing protein n=1 Tax=Paenibacillus sp. GYB004 TaxID=2994393 RepID=UPI002F963EB4